MHAHAGGTRSWKRCALYIDTAGHLQSRYWKAPRISGHVKKNPDEFVKEVTGFALKAKTEQARIETLTILKGVSWPMASIILHFFHKDPYPIIDFRALWSVSLDLPSQYNFDFWMQYVKFCRKIAEAKGVGMLVLDRALWQFSKERQS